MVELLTIALLALIWAQLRIERSRQTTEHNIEFLGMSSTLYERISQLKKSVDDFAKANGTCVFICSGLRTENKTLKRRLANRKGQITKLKKKLAVYEQSCDPKYTFPTEKELTK